jgi:SAM-dependent methyltransferase
MSSLRWPLPAALTWGACWVVFIGVQRLGGVAWAALLVACGVGLGCAAFGSTRWRRAILALGFPLSLALSGGGSVSGWVWLLLLAVLLALYPLNAWRDAPLFPTPAHALRDLCGAASLPQGARVLDAGCGLGDGLKALRDAYPDAELHGIEWSWPLRAACALRCPWARVRQGDIWRADWSPYAMVYLFQRPESMARAAAKAKAELAPGAWLVSLEFEATELRPTGRLLAPDGRAVWLYRM